jgi:hypothetical protein
MVAVRRSLADVHLDIRGGSGVPPVVPHPVVQLLLEQEPDAALDDRPVLPAVHLVQRERRERDVVRAAELRGRDERRRLLDLVARRIDAGLHHRQEREGGVAGVLDPRAVRPLLAHQRLQALLDTGLDLRAELDVALQVEILLEILLPLQDAVEDALELVLRRAVRARDGGAQVVDRIPPDVLQEHLQVEDIVLVGGHAHVVQGLLVELLDEVVEDDRGGAFPHLLQDGHRLRLHARDVLVLEVGELARLDVDGVQKLHVVEEVLDVAAQVFVEVPAAAERGVLVLVPLVGQLLGVHRAVESVGQRQQRRAEPDHRRRRRNPPFAHLLLLPNSGR